MLSIKVDKDSQALRAFRELIKKTRSPKPALERIGETLWDRIDERFDSKRDPSGLAWLPWSNVTRKLRAREPWASLLEHTGQMRAGLRYRVRARHVDVGLSADYAPVQEFGDDGLRIPPRPMLFSGRSIAPGDARAALNALADYYSL